jgi:hypothetical protein
MEKNEKNVFLFPLFAVIEVQELDAQHGRTFYKCFNIEIKRSIVKTYFSFVDLGKIQDFIVIISNSCR